MMNVRFSLGCHRPIQKVFSVSKKVVLITATVLWSGAVIAATTFSADYESRPGAIGAAPLLNNSSTTAVRTSTPYLIMFAHPHCPCTRASLEELQQLLADFPDLKATVYFYKPSSFEKGWEKTELWRKSLDNSRLQAIVDIDGRMAKLFNASTSGEVLVYDRNDKLMFSGGITAARGHVGDNFGVDAIADMLRNPEKETIPKVTPVFGCAILTHNCSSFRKADNVKYD
jgi:hypothetical protein